MKNSNRIEALDSLRGIASVIVVIFHCLITFDIFYDANYKHQYSNIFIKWFTLPPLHTVWAGYESVILFFVLSGFVLSLPYLNNKSLSYKNYVIRRICRIYIPYIVMMLVASVLVTFIATYQNYPNLSSTFNNRWNHSVTFKSIVSYFLMIDYDTPNVNGVVWSLIHEMRISIIFPFLMLFVIKSDYKKVLPISFMSCYGMYFLLRYIAPLVHISTIGYVINGIADTCFFVIFFLFGALLAKYKITIVNYIKPMNLFKKCVLAILALIFINFRSIYFFNEMIIDDLINSIGVVIVFVLVLSSSNIQAVLNMRVLKWLGKISFSLYLTHILVFMLTITYLSKVVPINVSILLAPLFTIPIAYLTYELLELPSNKLGKFLTSQKKIKQTSSQKSVTI